MDAPAAAVAAPAATTPPSPPAPTMDDASTPPSAPALSIASPLSSPPLVHVSESPAVMDSPVAVSPSSMSPAKRARHSVNLLRVGTAALRRELEEREWAEATAASLAASSGHNKSGRKRVMGAEEAAAGLAASSSSADAAAAAGSSAQAAAPMQDVWADEEPIKQTHQPHADHVDLTQDEPVSHSQPLLFAEGASVPVAAPPLHHPHTFSGAFPLLTQQPAARPPSNGAVVRDFFRHYSQNRAGGGAGRRGRPLRTAHAMPAMHQMETDHLPSMHQRGLQLNHMQQMPPMPQLDAIFNAAPPLHGHPPGFHTAAAAAGDGGVVDLTQEGAAAAAAAGDSDVQVISHTQGAGEYVGYNAFNPAFSQAPAYDAYAAAFRAATSTSSYSYSASPPPSEPVPLSTDQFASLSKEQQAVVLAIQRGKNVFFSGCAGTGKSHLLKLLTQFLPKRSTFFTASTGLAAVNIGGSTLHSFAGIGLGEGDPVKLAARAAGNRRARDRWLDCKVLVIDEISMISGQLFDKLELVARTVRKNQQPFGGVQLVLSGDFLQLPPVKATKPTFRADTWEKCVDLRIVLTKVFRQQGDPTFINLLANLRFGLLTLKDECILKKSHYNNLPPVEGVLPTKLNPLKKDTAEENGKFLAALPEPAVVFKAKDTFESEAHMQLLAKDCPAIADLHLKAGAQVMLLKNLDPANGLCNGSRGVILDFVKMHMESGGVDGDGSDDEQPPPPITRATTTRRIEMDDNGCVLRSSPTEEAAAAAASSSNGATPAEATTDGSTPAAAAAAAAAVTINSAPFYADESKGMFGGRVRAGNSEDVYLLPRVRFENGVVQVIESDKFELTVQDKVMARRQQVPLTLAWALTIHKSQGMTLDRAEINAQGMFENGQLYVAVSRVKSIPGLRLRGFTRDTMRTDMSVVDWYKKLERETELSTRELLKDVDKEYPQLKAVMEAQKMQRKEEEIQEKKDKAAGVGAAAAASSSSSAAAAASSAAPPIAAAAAAASPSFMSASKLFGVPASVKVEKPPPSPLAAFRSASSSLKQEGGAVKAEPAPGWVGPPPKPFRSPIKDPAAAAASTAAAQSELHAVNQSRNLCCVCQTERASYVVLECMHMCLCDECKDNFRAPRADTSPPGVAKQCPVCRARIKDVRKVFSS